MSMFYGTTCPELENFLIFLPPNKDCLPKHLQRANYQAAVRKQSTSCSIDAPSPVNHGWKLNQERKISIQWMDGNCAPYALLANCNPRANGAKRRSGRKPGARVTNFVLAELKVVARDR